MAGVNRGTGRAGSTLRTRSVQVLQAGEKTEAEYFRHLTGAWVQVAYAVLPVSNDEMGRLCDQWPFVEKGGAA